MNQPTLLRHEWHFDDVPDTELVGCCYWEYARESAFICTTLRKYRNEWILPARYYSKRRGPRKPLPASAFIRSDGFLSNYAAGSAPQSWENMERIQTIGYPAEVFVRGCCFQRDRIWQSDDPGKPNYRHPQAPPITGSFPDPWQSLAVVERKYRAHIRGAVEGFRAVPVRLGSWTTAKEMGRHYQAIADGQHAEQKEWERAYLRRDEKGNFYQLPGAPEPPHFEPIRPSLSWGVSENLVVEIAWDLFTNDEIVTYFRKWVKRARPKDMPEPDDRGKKIISWRVALERLAILRLLHQCPLKQLPMMYPDAWKKYNTPYRRWRRDAENARTFFLKLFPILPPGELPASWPPKDGPTKPV